MNGLEILLKSSAVSDDEERIKCKMKNIEEFNKMHIIDKIDELMLKIPYYLKEKLKITANTCIKRLTQPPKMNPKFVAIPIMNNVFDGIIFSNNPISKDDNVYDKGNNESETNKENIKLQCCAITSNEYTLRDLIALAQASFDNNLLHSIRTFYGTKAHRITAKSHLHDDVVMYWIKICLNIYPNGKETAFVDTSAFSEFETYDINNQNSENNRLLMPKVEAVHWTLYHFDYGEQKLEFFNSLKALEPHAPDERSERIAKDVIRTKLNYDTENINCITPVMPNAFHQTDGYQCGVFEAAMIEAIIQGRSLEEFAKTFHVKRYRKRMQKVFEHILKNDNFPFELFLKSENVPVKEDIQNGEETSENIKRVKSASAERKQKQREQMTPEQKEEEKKRNRERAAERRKAMDAKKKAAEDEEARRRMADKRKSMTKEEKDAAKKEDRQRKADERKSMTKEERDAAKKEDRQRKADERKSMTKEERAKAKDKERKRHARRWKSMTEKQKERKKKRDRSRKRGLRRKRKQTGNIVTAKEKAAHATVQQRYRAREKKIQKLHCQSRLKRVLKLMNDIKNSDYINLQSEMENYLLLTKNDYARIRQLFSRQKRYGHVHSSVLHRYRKIKKVHRHLNALKEINSFVENITNNGKHMENIKKYTELGVLLQIRNKKQPEDEKEACVQLLQAQYTCKKVNSMKIHATELLEKALNALENQLKIDNVKWLENETPEDHLVRVIGRIPYHLKKKKEKNGDEFSSLEELYPSLFKTFMGMKDESVEDAAILNDGENIDTSDINIIDANINVNNVDGVRIDFDTNFDDDDEQLKSIIVEDNVMTYNDNQETIELHPPMDDEAEKFARKVSQKADECEPKSSQINEMLNNAVDEDVLADEEAIDNAGPLRHIPLRITTKIKPCSADCPVLTSKKAEILHKSLSNLCNQRGEDLIDSLTSIMEEKNETFESTLFAAMKLFDPCKTGVRSILRRFNDIKTFAFFLARIDLAYETCNYEELQAIGHYYNVPRCIMLTNSAEYFDYEEKLTEEAAFKKFGVNIEAFHKAISENETETCVICNQLTLPSNITKLNFKTAENYMTKYAKAYYEECPEEFKACKTCSLKINKKTMPAAAVINGFGLDPTHKIEQQLNWVERALCQLVRPVQSIVTLRDVSGRYTNIKGKKGALVLLPVPTENTVTHMSNILPCSKGLTIIVNTTVGKALVRLPLVIKYLKLLKDHNPLYKDIEINENFTFDKDENLIFNKPPTAEQIQSLIANNNDEPHLLTQDVDIQPISNVEDETPDGTAMEQYQQYALQKCPYLPQDINMKDIDALSFPELHTEGNFGFDHERHPKVTKRQYIRNRLKNSNRRFATNAKWLTFCQGLLEIKDIKDSISTQARIGKDKLKGDNLKRMLDAEDETLQQCMSSQFSALRGHKAYWQKVKLDLKAHIAIFGAPNWFLTLNPSEKDWKELHEAYSKVYGIEVNSKNIRDLIAEDPMIWCRHFQRRVNEFFKTCLFVDNCPLGKVTNHFYRIEYQHRGTEHIHCLLWVEGAPEPGDDDDKIIKYIDERVTASMPDPVKSPLLHELVNKHQKHWKSHSSTCKRLFKHKGQVYTKCRFEFPRTASSTTRINRLASPLLTLGGAKTKFYTVRRKKGEEQWINDYSPELLLAWQANMDIQYLSSDLMDIVNYVTGYTTKGESSKTESLLDSLKGEHISKRDKFRIYMSMLKQREMGLMEIVDMLMGHQMYRFDSGHVFINSNRDDKRSRILKPKAKIVDGEDAYETNWYDTYYPKRSEKFEGFSLFNMLINFKIRNNKDEKNLDEDMDESEICVFNNPFSKAFHINDIRSPFFGHVKIKAGTEFHLIDQSIRKLMVKHRALVPRLYWPKLEANNEEAREDYYRRLIFLFIPWRIEGDLKSTFGTFEERWNAFMKELEISSVDAFNDISTIIRNQTMQLEMEKEIFDKRKELKDALRLQIDDDEFEDENFLEVFERIVDEERHNAAKEKINKGQREIFDSVLKTIVLRESDNSTEPLRMFCSGTAGTGKSFLINLLANELALKYALPNDSTSTKPATLIGAPTGLAAIQINGSTLHSLFSINVQRGTEGKMKSLSKEALNLKRILFQNVKLIIIDETFMVSNIMLAKIHSRLCEFMDKNQAFGGANLLFFGDLLQLPPVKSKPIFVLLESYQLKKVFDSAAPPFSFWEYFQYAELTENMRQKKSLEFAELLGRMRVEALTQADHDLLRSKIIETPNGGLPNLQQFVQKYIEIKDHDPTVMALFGCSDEVAVFNNEVTKQLKLNAVMIEAEDTDIAWKSKKSASSKSSRIYQERRYRLNGNTSTGRKRRSRFTKNEQEIIDKDDQRAAAGLVKKLYLAENSRVMLRRNLNCRIGLVNGATGILRQIIFENGKPNELRIKFDNIEEEQLISKTSAIYDIGAEEQCCRRQFPVVVAFACTIHKSQGLTLRNVFISMESIFAGGQAFVAFSRVETIDGLYLADYHSLKIFVKKSCLQEYNRLRTTIELPPFAIPSGKKPDPSTSLSQNVPQSRFRKRSSLATNVIVPPKIPRIENDSEDIIMDEDPDNFDLVYRDVNNESLRLYENTGSDCFLIAALNFLQRLKPVIDSIIVHNYDDNNQLLHEVACLFLESPANRVTRVRRALPERYQTGFQCCLSVFDDILLNLSAASLETLTIAYVQTKICQCRSRQPLLKLGQAVTIDINKQNVFPETVQRMTFDEFFATWSQARSLCSGCETTMITTKRLHDPNNTTLHYIRINIENESRRRPLNITGFSDVTMFNIEWRLIAAVEHIPRPGHFITWVLVDSQWKLIDDNVIYDAQRLKTNIGCYRMLLYQRIQ